MNRFFFITNLLFVLVFMDGSNAIKSHFGFKKIDWLFITRKVFLQLQKRRHPSYRNHAAAELPGE